jgi:hypothetical protein
LETANFPGNPTVVLERLTEPLDEAPADEGGGEIVEGLEDVGASLVSDGQPPETTEPSERAFDYPAMPSQTFRTVDAAPRNTRLDGTPAQRCAALWEVVAFIGMKFGRSPLRSANAVADRRSIWCMPRF